MAGGDGAAEAQLGPGGRPPPPDAEAVLRRIDALLTEHAEIWSVPRPSSQEFSSPSAIRRARAVRMSTLKPWPEGQRPYTTSRDTILRQANRTAFNTEAISEPP